MFNHEKYSNNPNISANTLLCNFQNTPLYLTSIINYFMLFLHTYDTLFHPKCTAITPLYTTVHSQYILIC